jgi:hypothetical protein
MQQTERAKHVPPSEEISPAGVSGPIYTGRRKHRFSLNRRTPATVVVSTNGATTTSAAAEPVPTAGAAKVGRNGASLDEQAGAR